MENMENMENIENKSKVLEEIMRIKLKDNKKIIDKYFVKPDGTNNFKQPK